MVKHGILLLLIFSLTSCGIFYVTPFPPEIIFFKKYVNVDINFRIEYSRLYVLGNYVFLYVNGQNYQKQLFVYSTDLYRNEDEIGHDDPISECNTFAMIDSAGYYCIGNERYEINTTTGLIQHESIMFGNLIGDKPPDGFGFSYGGVNYYLWWDYGLNIRVCNVNWVPEPSSADINLPLSGFNDLEAFYYQEDGTRLIFCFKTNEDDIVILNICVTDLLGTIFDYQALFDDNSFRLNDINLEYFYFTGDGYVILDKNEVFYRYDLDGNYKKELFFGPVEYSEVYCQDGKTRFLFSETYSRLIQTEVWW